MIRVTLLVGVLSLVAGIARALSHAGPAEADLPVRKWVQLRDDASGARRGCAVRYAPEAGAFFLWGFMDADPEFRQEEPAMAVPEYDMVAFDLDARRWRDHLPARWEAQWSKKLPPTFVPRCYHGLTSGSERSLFRPPEGYPAEAARPDPNIVFDQAAYHPPTKSLVYFAGGLTAAYHVTQRRWTNLAPAHAPPPVLGGALAHDPLNNELVLFGGGHVAEEGPDGRIVGYTGTWAYSFADRDWRRLSLDVQPPPRMYSRLVCDPKNEVLFLFGGDGQSHYLADTWLFDLKTRRWRASRVPRGPPPRAGHFAVYDPHSGWVFVGGGFNGAELTDLWAYDAANDRWQRLDGSAPAGAYITADLAPDKRLLLAVSNSRAPNHTRSCDIHYAVRRTFAYRLDDKTPVRPDIPLRRQPMPKRPAGESGRGSKPDPQRQKAQAERLRNLPANQWVALADPGRVAPVRSWGSAAFDSDRGRILYWGGGHCSYGGSEVDAYDVAAHTWVSSEEAPEYPHLLWARGVRLAGVTFGGNPWTEHGRRVYAYDPTSRKLLAVRSILLTTGYEPARLRDFPGEPRARVDAKVKPPTTYSKYATWSFDPDSGRWDLIAPAPVGLDTLVTTKHGVLGVNVDWPTRLNDAGYLLPWSPDQPEKDNAVYLFDSDKRSWKRLGERQPSPQNLYEMTSLAHDSKRDRLLLHGGGKDRDELWAFNLKTHRWQNLRPKVSAPAGAAPPVCNREAVYLPEQDVLLTYGPAPGKERLPALWTYRGEENAWYRIVLDSPPGIEPRSAGGQNRALVYDSSRDLVFLVVAANDRAEARVYALRYRHEQAKRLEAREQQGAPDRDDQSGLRLPGAGALRLPTTFPLE
jgi:hypothetical protein